MPSGTKDSFISKAIEVHGDRYDYSLVEYIKSRIKVKIRCYKHGIFKQTPNKHLMEQGCPKCARELKHYNELTTESFIAKAKEIHGDKYDYSLVEYKKSRFKVKIICHKHGIFEQTPNNHLMKMKCIKCANEENGDKRRLTIQEFISRSIKVHGNKYDYSVSKYVDTHTKIKIKCPIHGIFKQLPLAHAPRGQGCPRCDESHGERAVALFLDSNKIKYKRQKYFKGCKNKRFLYFDFYIPSLNTLIEYDGRQHFYPSEYFGGIPAFNLLKKLDAIKNKFCKDKGINLIRISYKKKNIESFLINELKIAVN